MKVCGRELEGCAIYEGGVFIQEKEKKKKKKNRNTQQDYFVLFSFSKYIGLSTLLLYDVKLSARQTV